ncbi:MAG: hypothetical protein GXO19_00400 [Epsilonproteobacteria bacterium]|nr:hypothetical protein [Campylobacterota bacterium]NPA56172.1 hypothetical protein [Campylobacterota bacterium]
MRLDLKVMFFDSRRDYLPHYRSFKIEAQREWNLKELLARIGELDEEFDYNTHYPLLRINSTVVPYGEKVGEVIDHFGSDLVIDPVSKYRSIDDLLIDEEDFQRAFALIEPYATMEDRYFFLSNKELHYASATFEFDREYIGDAVLVTAYRMIKRGNPHREEILRAISEDVSGLWSCEFENMVFKGRDYGEWIEELKSWLQPPRPDLFWRICSQLTKKKQPPLVERLDEVPVALYRPTEEMERWMEEQGAVLTPFPRANRRAGQSLVEVNPDLAYKKGAALLLDAMDNGAELLVTSSLDDAAYFRSNFGHFERVSGREIYIDIIAFQELQEIELREEVA